jgi:hypothetical protein
MGVRRRSWGALLALAVVFAAALALRLYGINWDGGQWIHPDERMILMVVNNRLSLPTHDQMNTLLTPQSPLNPAFHAYGSFPLYLLKAAQLLTADRFPLHLLARSLSIAFDCGTLLLVYALATSLAGAWWGVLAALLIAISPIHVQLAHYYTVDTMLAFWAALGAWLALRLAATGRSRWAVVLAILTGVAAATKLVGAALLLFVWLGWYMALLRSAKPIQVWKRLLLPTLRSTLAAGIAVIAFVVTDPYAVIDGLAFLNEVGAQATMARGDPRFPYILQFYYTLPYVYPFVQNLTRGWGIGAGLLVWAGLLWGAVRTILARRLHAWSMLVAWVLAFFAVLGAWHTKFPRYLLPIMPLASVLAVCMLAGAWNRWRRALSRTALVVLTLTLVGMSGTYALATDGVFGREHPWVSASRWIYENVPRRAMVLTEYWDMALPLPLAIDGTSRARTNYRQVELHLYDADTLDKWKDLARTLADADYYIVASQRVYGPTGLLREVYPTTSRFYELLFQERLGFSLAHWEANDPLVLGVRLVEGPFARAGLPVPAVVSSNWSQSGTLLLPGGDESWTVYDRPLTLIFRNEDRLSAEEMLRLLAP